MKERGTLVLKERSWHTRLYRFWQRTNPRIASRKIPGKPLGYKENLCHYWRVVVFWAPIRAFLFAHPKRATWLRPWVPVAAAVAIGSLTTAIILWPSNVLYAFLFTLAGIGGFCLLLGLVSVIDRYEAGIKTFFSKIGRGLWKVFGPVCRGLGAAIEWFLCTNIYLNTIFPWSIFVVVALIVLAGLWPLYVGIALGSVFALIGLGAFVSLIGFHVQDELENLPKRTKKVKPDTGPGMIKVTGRYLISKKHGICPFIEIED